MRISWNLDDVNLKISKSFSVPDWNYVFGDKIVLNRPATGHVIETTPGTPRAWCLSSRSKLRQKMRFPDWGWALVGRLLHWANQAQRVDSKSSHLRCIRYNFAWFLESDTLGCLCFLTPSISSHVWVYMCNCVYVFVLCVCGPVVPGWENVGQNVISFFKCSRLVEAL